MRKILYGLNESILKRGDIGYVGSRLHADIYAINYKIRSSIIAMDNKVIEIAKDIQKKLEELIISSFPMAARLK